AGVQTARNLASAHGQPATATATATATTSRPRRRRRTGVTIGRWDSGFLRRFEGAAGGMMQTVAERTEGAEPAKGAEPSGVAEPADRAPSPGGLWAPERRSLSLGLVLTV